MCRTRHFPLRYACHCMGHLRDDRPGKMPLEKLTETLPTYPCNLKDPPGAFVIHSDSNLGPAHRPSEFSPMCQLSVGEPLDPDYCPLMRLTAWANGGRINSLAMSQGEGSFVLTICSAAAREISRCRLGELSALSTLGSSGSVSYFRLNPVPFTSLLSLARPGNGYQRIRSLI